jgi:predicted enzyme related to lactoylglutathione lyase
MANAVVHFEIVGKDPAALKRFYTGLFDWTLNESGGPVEYATVDTGAGDNGRAIGGGIGAGPEGYEGHVTFYVSVDDVEASLARAEELGGKRTMGPHRIEASEATGPEDFEIGLFTDPEGRTVGLFSLV